jgi:hypothetical protein
MIPGMEYVLTEQCVLLLIEKDRKMKFRKVYLSHWKPPCCSFFPVLPIDIAFKWNILMAFSSPYFCPSSLSFSSYESWEHRSQPLISNICSSPDDFVLSVSWFSLGLCSVSQASIDYLLSHGTGNLVGIVVGGVGEALQSVPNTTTLLLKKRKGFVRTALQHG